jgi:hypothetical protein
MRPAEELATLRMPVLVIGGGTDLQVGRADFDALAAAGPDVESRWFNSMNHVLVDAPADRSANLATYWDASLPLTDGLSDAIADSRVGAERFRVWSASWARLLHIRTFVQTDAATRRQSHQ